MTANPWLSEFVKVAHENWSSEAEEAIARRGVTQAQIELYRLGFVGAGLPEGPAYPDEFLAWWRGKKVVDSYVLPLTNCTGKIRGIQLRSIVRDKKGYLDWFETKSEAVFFGLGEAMPHLWESPRTLLVEGAFDLFHVQKTFPGVICTLHAGVSPALWRVLRRMVSHVTLAWDNDATGFKQSMAVIKGPFTEFFSKIDMISFPKESFKGKWTKDPEELWCMWGSAKLDGWLRSELAKTDPEFTIGI